MFEIKTAGWILLAVFLVSYAAVSVVCLPAGA